MAANVYNDSIRDAEYVARVRRHSPSSLIPLLADIASQYWERDSWLKSPYKKFTPWALADIARVSLISGNEHRSTATVDDLLQCAAAYVSVNDPELSGHDADSVTGFLLRITAEQLSYAQTPYNEVGRTAALFAAHQAVEDTESHHRRLGGSTFRLHPQSVCRNGVLRPGGRGKERRAVLGRVVQQSISCGDNSRDASRTPSCHHRKELREGCCVISNEQTEEPGRCLPPLYLQPTSGQARCLGNSSRTAGSSSRTAVPQDQPKRRVLRRRAEHWGNSFTDDVGDLFEQYIGRQLATIPNAQVHPEILYDNGSKRSVDWIVVCDDVVILVEVKSVRPTEAVRRLGKTSEAGAELRRMLGRAYKQLEKSDALIGCTSGRLCTHTRRPTPRWAHRDDGAFCSRERWTGEGPDGHFFGSHPHDGVR